MKARFNVKSMYVFGKYKVLGRGLILYLGGGVIINVDEDVCTHLAPFSMFACTSREFAEKVANEVKGLVAVPIDEVYVAESGGFYTLQSDFVGAYRFIAIPLDLAFSLAEGASVPVDSPELERAADLMACRGIAVLERGCMRLVDEDVRKSIMRQVKRILSREEAMLSRIHGGGCGGG